MRAIMATSFGPPDVLEPAELPTPQPGTGRLLVRVDLVGVHWVDTMVRLGRGPAVFPVTPPYVPGSGVAGTVVAVGDGVDDAWLGAKVVTRVEGGAYAEMAVAKAADALVVPEGLDSADALAVLFDGSTALALLERTPVHAGEKVLVMPGVGGAGSLLVQLANAAGATVIAAVRGEQKRALAEKLGAVAVEYDQLDSVGELDVVFDGIGGELGTTAIKLVKDGGRFSRYGMAAGGEVAVGAADGRRLASVVGMEQLQEFWPDAPRRMRYVLNEAAAGRLTPIIGRIYPLEQAATAHEDIAGRRFVGKILLTTGQA
ncbi:zinc-binding dehydrogenase [Kutzneria buriramensis]|uniref:NADPH:quinone reductase-like Zn-dependent oxidoreductase n=1 Tax=Kutzneria buriramensis TaxID=1045776 RepID=A0A3E0H1X7_9PSEU|nr:zinc-binding dehydrogenase [Kutzneria buriramensis]REH37034.1 NADPH:quinone reductase-like Zn-dependent oxidoreductase [Kutzneria buriramensis]